MTTIARPDARQHRPDPAYLRELLARAGISQRAAARALDLDERSIRYYAAGEKEMPYTVQYCLEVLAAGGVGDQAPPLEASTWHEAAVRPITKADAGRLIIGAGAGGWVFGRIRADDFGPVIEGVLVEGSVPVAGVARYTLIEE